MENYPVFKFKVKEDGTQTGMLGISLVDEPAIESSFVTFKAEDVVQTHYVALKDEKGEYKQELLGAALRPDLPILRKDDAGNFYYGIFDKETIETIRNKFHKQKNTSEVNLQHNPEAKIDAYLIESYLLQTEAQLEATKSFGLEDIELGAWIVRYKVESEELFNQIIKGEVDVKGFSVEIMLERELVEASKNNFNSKNTIMSKFNELIDRFKSVLAEFEEQPQEETTELEDVTVAESGMVLRYTEAGAPVMEVTVDDEGNEETVQAAEGEFILEDGRIVVVDADGNLVEIKEAEEEVEPVEEEMEEATEATEETTEEEVSTEEMEAETEETTEEATEENLEETTEESGSDMDKKLSELIPLDSDGTYQLEVYVSDGKISFGTLYAYTYKDLKFAELVEEFEHQKQEIEELKKQPVAKPVFSEFRGESNNRKSKKEFKSNLDYQLHRLGLDND